MSTESPPAVERVPTYEAAALIRKSPETLRRYVKLGLIPAPIRLRRDLLWDVAALRRLLQGGTPDAA
jgi:hypothetical protein